MKKKIYSFIIFSLFIAPVFSQTVHKKFFKPLGKDQTWTVPAGVTQIEVKLWGAGGAGDNYFGTSAIYQNGGGGGFATGIINVTSGEKLTIIVGAGGLPGAGAGAYGGGGGKGCGLGGRGGGRSAIRNSSGTELITAGAGGGGGDFSLDSKSGNGGGGLIGAPSHWLPYDGSPGTQSAGGSGGTQGVGGCTCGSLPGSQFLGGYAKCGDNGFNGSGGGGYYGGGSGTDLGDGAGGGGSSFIPAGGNTIAATNNIPGNTSDPDYRGNAGYGGQKGKPGICGLVVIIYSDNSLISNIQNENAVVARIEKINKATAYPNPAKDVVTINYSAQKNGKHIFEITDIRGRILLHKETNAIQGANHTTLDVSRFVKGIYFINIIKPDKAKESIQINKE